MLYKYGFQHFVTNGNIQVTHFLVGSKKKTLPLHQIPKENKNVFGYKMRYPCFMVSFLNVNEDHIVR